MIALKIHIISDLHLEVHGSGPEISNQGADVLVIGGDITCADHLRSNPTAGLSDLPQHGFHANDAELARGFLRRVSDEWPNVLLVMGNHEHYHGRWDRTESIMRDECARYPNVHLLEQDRLELGGVVFLGATLWSSLNEGDPMTMHAIRDMMSDYRAITEKDGERYHKLRPITTLERHRETVRWLDIMLAEDKRPTVVITHHCPSHSSIHPKYAKHTLMNGAFTTNLDRIMMDNDHLLLWTHGHTHERFDYQINRTRVVCNPRGYPGEHSGFDPNLVIEIG